MLQAAAAFGAGFLAQSSVQTTCAQAPTCTATPSDGGTPFKLSVRVHAASVPALAEPSRMLKLKMRLGISLAGIEKETENADFAGPASSSAWFTLRDDTATPSSGGVSRNSSDRSSNGKFGAGTSRASPAEWASWRFGDTLTFAARARDLLDSGMRFRLHVQSDVCLGPVSVQMPHRAQEFGEAVVDLRHRVLPVAVPAFSTPPFLGGIDCEFESQPSWDTPALVFPLSHVSDSPHSGVEVSTLAKVALSFSLNVDPEVLMREVDAANKPLPYKVLASCLQVPLAPLALCAGEGNESDEAAAWAAEAVSWGCADGAVTPRPCERQPQAIPVLPRPPPACNVGLRKV